MKNGKVLWIIVAVVAGAALGGRAAEIESIIEPIDSPTPAADLTFSAATPSLTDVTPETAAPILPPPASAATAAPFALPTKTKIADVPFVPQAPHQIWDATHEETCEEAAVLTVHYFLTGRNDASPDEIEADLQAMIAWQNERFGTFEDTTAAQTAEILRDYLNYGGRVRVIPDAALDDLRREIAAGRPVIVPAAGRLLGNRYFKTPGPIYHMTVAIGYDQGEIITNDPGTRRGRGYRYPVGQFWNAVHDFVDRTDEGMARGAKTLIVVD